MVISRAQHRRRYSPGRSHHAERDGYTHDDTRERFVRRAFTLVELVLVLVILVILAAVVIPIVDGFSVKTITGEKTKEEIVTETTMLKIRDAILGTPTQPGAWPDLGQRPDMFEVLAANPSVLLSASAPAGVPSSLAEFDPVTKLGWRGPYLHATLSVVDGRIIDAWGNGIGIQATSIDFNGNGTLDNEDHRYARLVSAGDNGDVDAPPNRYVPNDGSGDTGLSLDDCVDDVVVFFRVADTREWE